MAKGRQPQVPESILIVGTGVFGLSTLHYLLQWPEYAKLPITVVSPSIPESLSPSSTSANTADAAASKIASNDINRIIRADYADYLYSKLMSSALPLWKNTPGLSKHYHESGLLLTAENDTPAVHYVRESLANTTKYGYRISEYNTPGEVAAAIRAPGVAKATGDFGYLNAQSGWADAGRSLEWMWDEVAKLSQGRNIRFVRDMAQKVLYSKDGRQVRGIALGNKEEVTADLTLLAAGAWTPALLDLSGIASAHGECIAYVDVTEQEANRLRDIPVHFNLSRGCFFFPPNLRESGGWEIKVACHGYGYSNPQASHDGMSLPAFPESLPRADQEKLVGFLKTCLPSMEVDSRDVRMRMCWYLDTASSDFIVGFHPDFSRSLFVATGGSGHAFKFLPVLGARIVKILEGTDLWEAKGTWTKKWKWPQKSRDSHGDVVKEVWCMDGSRSGKPGETLEQALSEGKRPQPTTRSRL